MRGPNLRDHEPSLRRYTRAKPTRSRGPNLRDHLRDHDVPAAPLFIADDNAHTSTGEGGRLREDRLLADGGVSGEGEADESGVGGGAGPRGVDSRKATLAALMSKLKDEVFVSLVPCALSLSHALAHSHSRAHCRPLLSLSLYSANTLSHARALSS